MVGLAAQGPGWTQGSDDDVRSALTGELERLESADPFAALGVDYQTDDDGIRAAFLNATKILHPNRFARRDPDTRRIANEVYLRVKAAYDKIQDPKDRLRVLGRLGKGTAPEDTVAEEQPEAAPDAERTAPAKPTSMAARRRAAARRAAASRRPSTASPTDVRKRVAKKEEEVEAEYEAAKQLIREGKLPGARDAFRALAAAHTTERRYRTWMHYAMGRCHEADRDHDRAREEYRRALATDDRFELAKKALDGLPSEPPAPRKGLFSRLFKK